MVELAGSATSPSDLELEVVELAGSTLPGRRELVGGREERGRAGDDVELRWRRSAASPARRRWRSAATSLAPAGSGLLHAGSGLLLAGARQIHRRSAAGADLCPARRLLPPSRERERREGAGAAAPEIRQEGGGERGGGRIWGGRRREGAGAALIK